MIERDHGAKPDRKLGDEWIDWDDNMDPSELEIDESRGVFFTLAASIVFLFIALVPVGWYLIKPRIEQFHPLVSNLVGWAVFSFTIIFVSLVLAEGIFLLKYRKSLIPYRWV